MASTSQPPQPRTAATQFVTSLFGYRETDTFVIRQAAAATFGYAVMGIRRGPFAASLVELLSYPTALPAVVGLASGVCNVAFVLALRRSGGQRRVNSLLVSPRPPPS